ncbi:amidohydrolase family protein [Caballeronia sp. HLA56]
MTTLAFELPPHACDCHTHVFPDSPNYPYSSARKYTPPFASVAQLRATLHGLQIPRVVIVQPSVYGSDNAATLDAVAEIGQQHARAVVVIDDHATDAHLDALHEAGARGVRLNLEMLAEHDPARCTTLIRHTASKLSARGWHIQLYSRLGLIASLADVLGELDVPVVLDHFARANAADGVRQPGFDVILELVRAGNAYVKLSAPYLCSNDAPRYDDLANIAKALIEANPARMLWASNWPHPNPAHAFTADRVSPPEQVDDAGVLNLLAKWAPDTAVRRRILADNPASLYGFPTGE